MSSWSCSACTFLNPSSQKLTCQVCQTPSPITSSSLFPSTTPSSSSSSAHKWACKACTFLNSYSRTNCEICDTRAPSAVDHDDADDDLVVIPSSSSADVGSVFFPLRKCNSSSTSRVHDPDDSKLDMGFQDKVRIEMSTDHFGGSSKNFPSLKSKFEDSVSAESTDAISSVGTIKNEYSGGAMDTIKEKNHGGGTIKQEDLCVALNDPMLANIVDDSECSIVLKRKHDPSTSDEKPALNGFRDVKSSKKQAIVTDEKVRTVGARKHSVSEEIAGNTDVKNVSCTIKILSYNVWFRDELEGYLRMQAIGNLIQLHSPDVICFQEVNSVIYSIFQRSNWWKKYSCSVSFERAKDMAYFCMQLSKLPIKSFSSKPYRNTAMMRELCLANVEVNKNKSLVIATTHLESPCPGPPKWDQMYSKERVEQAKESIRILQNHPNVIFCGDMNWDDKLDGRFPYPEGWFDAWEKLRPAEVGWTYDTKTNKMLSGFRALQKRLDRFICHLPDFKICSIEMIGTEPIPGVEHQMEKKVRGKIQHLTLPVYPSDHYGLILTVTG